MGPREVKGHVMRIIAQFIQCKLLFAIRCDTVLLLISFQSSVHYVFYYFCYLFAAYYVRT